MTESAASPPALPGLADGPRQGMPDYAELHCLSNFSFLRGASHPGELVVRADELGYRALAITDECSLAGIVRAHTEAKARGLKLLIGSEFHLSPAQSATTASLPATATTSFPADAPRLVVIARNRAGYARLSAFITRLRRTATKARYHLALEDIAADELADCCALLVPAPTTPWTQLLSQARWLRHHFHPHGWLAVELHQRIGDKRWLRRLRRLGQTADIPLVAAGDVHMHVRARKPLQDVLSATRLGLTLRECGERLQDNAERHLRSRLRLATLYPADLLAATLTVAAACDFSLDELRYAYPEEVVPAGETPASHLRKLTEQGAARRFPTGLPPEIADRIAAELALIAELGYEKYFLTVQDIVAFARQRGILCQGRGSAANSAVCYCLGITEVDPARLDTLFERFISRERNEPPDIDIDFEHDRREEVIQYLYAKYGRERAALAAVVITYRTRSAIRDVGKALGFAAGIIDHVAKGHHRWHGPHTLAEQLAQCGIDPQSHGARQWHRLVAQLKGFPRHLSQHPGGFVISGPPLSSLVPVENAAMPARTLIQWDKDDLDAVGLLKVDVLALGMLSAIRRALELVALRHARPFTLQDIPAECPHVYAMIQRADTIGVFQIESRAQQSMLPRLRPACFYDLVVEVAIVRPGPIQGGMVHPYLRRRQGLEPEHYPKEELRPVLARTKGVPIFQEQVMKIAMVAAGFSGGEADQLRRSMAAWRHRGSVERFRERLIDGMVARGYAPPFAESIFQQMLGFGEYGFPESHAASFALLAYHSSWLKCHEPAAFLTALLNAQPMGFYAPAQLIQDARRHGVEVRPADVAYSDIDSTLEEVSHGPGRPPHSLPPPAVRLGLRLISGLRHDAAAAIVTARRQTPFADSDDLACRAGLNRADMMRLASADAFASLAGNRRTQLWRASAQDSRRDLLHAAPVQEDLFALPAAPEAHEVLLDYAATGLTLRRHPLALLRPLLQQRRLQCSAQLHQLGDGQLARCCGIVTTRQQPGTAGGTLFVSLEDEHGLINVIVWAKVRDRFRDALIRARLLVVYGTWQRQGDVCHLVAARLEDASSLLGRLATSSRDFK